MGRPIERNAIDRDAVDVVLCCAARFALSLLRYDLHVLWGGSNAHTVQIFFICARHRITGGIESGQQRFVPLKALRIIFATPRFGFSILFSATNGGGEPLTPARVPETIFFNHRLSCIRRNCPEKFSAERLAVDPKIEHLVDASSLLGRDVGRF
jgi:hypothetical protein